MSIRFLIGSTSQSHANQMAKFLVSQGYRVLGTYDDSFELLRKVHTVYPDFVIIDGHMKGMNGVEICEVLVNDKLCPVIALINGANKSMFVNLDQELIFKSIIKPIKKNEFLSSIEFLYKAYIKVKELEQQVKTLNSKINDTNLIDEAKQLLMTKFDLTEEEAHRKIQKESMDKGIGKVKIAKIILMKYK